MTPDHLPLVVTAQDILSYRIAISAVFGLGVIYFVLISTTFRSDIEVNDPSTPTLPVQQDPSALNTLQGSLPTMPSMYVQHANAQPINCTCPSEGPPSFDEAEGAPMNASEAGFPSLPPLPEPPSEESPLSKGVKVIEINSLEETNKDCVRML